MVIKNRIPPDPALKNNQKIKLDEKEKIKLIIINWKTFKDRIKFFDEIIARLRIEGAPIAIGIFTLGYLTSFWVIYLLGIFYLIGILCLDILHFELLIISVKNAKIIENKFEGDFLTVTKELTTTKRTIFHAIGFLILYGVLIIAGIGLIIINPKSPSI